MAEIVNLNKARKAQAKRTAKAQAAENRVKFGTPKPLRDQTRQETARAARDLDGKKRND